MLSGSLYYMEDRLFLQPRTNQITSKAAISAMVSTPLRVKLGVGSKGSSAKAASLTLNNQRQHYLLSEQREHYV